MKLPVDLEAPRSFELDRFLVALPFSSPRRLLCLLRLFSDERWLWPAPLLVLLTPVVMGLAGAVGFTRWIIGLLLLLAGSRRSGLLLFTLLNFFCCILGVGFGETSGDSGGRGGVDDWGPACWLLVFSPDSLLFIIIIVLFTHMGSE